MSIEIVNHSTVKIDGQPVARPKGVGPCAWLAFWEAHLRGDFEDGFEIGFEAGYAKGWKDRSENNEYDERPE